MGAEERRFVINSCHKEFPAIYNILSPAATTNVPPEEEEEDDGVGEPPLKCVANSLILFRTSGDARQTIIMFAKRS